MNPLKQVETGRIETVNTKKTVAVLIKSIQIINFFYLLLSYVAFMLFCLICLSYVCQAFIRFVLLCSVLLACPVSLCNRALEKNSYSADFSLLQFSTIQNAIQCRNLASIPKELENNVQAIQQQSRKQASIIDRGRRVQDEDMEETELLEVTIFLFYKESKLKHIDKWPLRQQGLASIVYEATTTQA